MNKVTIHVGLDYHDSAVQVCVLDAAGKVLVNQPVANQAGFLDQLVRRHGDDIQAGIEACGGSAHLADELVACGWCLSQAHPGYVKRLKQNPDKTDHSDARLLADLVRVGYLPKVWLAPPAVRDLRKLVRYRRTLVRERTNIKLRIRAILREERVRQTANPWTRAWVAEVRDTTALGDHARWVIGQQLRRLEQLQQDIAAAEARLEETTADDPYVKRLRECRGIGLITAVTLRAEIGRFDRFRSGKQLARFCALTPWNASSGQRQADAGLIAAGNRELRVVLIEAAQRLCRFDPRWRAFSLRMKARGKPHNVIVVAVANRWMRGLYHQLCHLSA
jgi:transposase